MRPPPLLTTSRLTIRLATDDDVAALRRYYIANEAHLARWGPLPPPDFREPAHWRRQVALNQEAFSLDRSARLHLFPHADASTVIGHVSLNNIVRGAAFYCDLGYALDAAHQGQGLMSEAVSAAIAYAFGELVLHRVKAAYHPHNERSGRLLRRLGFVIEGYARDYLYLHGAWQDQILTGLINPDWHPPA